MKEGTAGGRRSEARIDERGTDRYFGDPQLRLLQYGVRVRRHPLCRNKRLSHQRMLARFGFGQREMERHQCRGSVCFRFASEKKPLDPES